MGRRAIQSKVNSGDSETLEGRLGGSTACLPAGVSRRQGVNTSCAGDPKDPLDAVISQWGEGVVAHYEWDEMPKWYLCHLQRLAQYSWEDVCAVINKAMLHREYEWAQHQALDAEKRERETAPARIADGKCPVEDVDLILAEMWLGGGRNEDAGEWEWAHRQYQVRGHLILDPYGLLVRAPAQKDMGIGTRSMGGAIDDAVYCGDDSESPLLDEFALTEKNTPLHFSDGVYPIGRLGDIGSSYRHDARVRREESKRRGHHSRRGDTLPDSASARLNRQLKAQATPGAAKIYPGLQRPEAKLSATAAQNLDHNSNSSDPECEYTTADDGADNSNAEVRGRGVETLKRGLRRSVDARKRPRSVEIVRPSAKWPRRTSAARVKDLDRHDSCNKVVSSDRSFGESSRGNTDSSSREDANSSSIGSKRRNTRGESGATSATSVAGETRVEMMHATVQGRRVLRSSTAKSIASASSAEAKTHVIIGDQSISSRRYSRNPPPLERNPPPLERHPPLLERNAAILPLRATGESRGELAKEGLKKDPFFRNTPGPSGASVPDISPEDHHPAVIRARSEITAKLRSGRLPASGWGWNAYTLVLRVVEAARPAALYSPRPAGPDSAFPYTSTAPSASAADALLLTPAELTAHLSRHAPDVPILCRGACLRAQPEGDTRTPIDTFFDAMAHTNQCVSLQDPSLGSAVGVSCQKVPMPSFVEHFRARRAAVAASGDSTPPPTDPHFLPLNALELPAPFLPKYAPDFLDAPNAQLLPHVRGHISSPSEVKKPTHHDAGGARFWADREHWTLLSEGGTATAPHTDATGFATWIAPQEGDFVLAWMTRPTRWEAEAWLPPRNAALLDSPHREETLGAGKWCIAVLAPGDVVVMPSATVHAVLRPDNSPTLAYGGHVLFYSAVREWMRTMIWQFANAGQVTNEDDFEQQTYRLVAAAEEIVATQGQRGGALVELMGGVEAVREYELLSAYWFKQYGKKLGPEQVRKGRKSWEQIKRKTERTAGKGTFARKATGKKGQREA